MPSKPCRARSKRIIDRSPSLQRELSDPGLYARDAAKFAALSARLAEISAARDKAEELWLALEMKREELDRRFIIFGGREQAGGRGVLCVGPFRWIGRKSAMKRYAIAGIAAGAAMMIGGALGAVSGAVRPPPKSRPSPMPAVMNPMIDGQAMLPGRNLLENISASPDHSTLVAAMKNSGLCDALKADGQFTVFAPTNAACRPKCWAVTRPQLARLMGYLVVPGKYDSQTLLKVIGEGGGQAKLRTVEGGILVARMNGPTNVILVDEHGNTADIAIYDVYDKNGVLHVVDRMLEPGASVRQVAANYSPISPDRTPATAASCARVAEGEDMIAIEQLAVRRRHQHSRNTLKTLGDAEPRRNLQILVETPDIDADEFVMGGDERLHLGQPHDVRKHDAVAAPVAAQVDHHALAAVAGAREGGGNRFVGVGRFVIRIHLHDRQGMDVCHSHLRRRNRSPTRPKPQTAASASSRFLSHHAAPGPFLPAAAGSGIAAAESAIGLRISHASRRTNRYCRAGAWRRRIERILVSERAEAVGIENFGPHVGVIAGRIAVACEGVLEMRARMTHDDFLWACRSCRGRPSGRRAHRDRPDFPARGNPDRQRPRRGTPRSKSPG